MSDAHTDNALQRYKYPLYPRIAGLLAGPFFVVFCFGIGIVLLMTHHLYGGIAFFLGGIFFTTVLLISFLTYSPIVISGEGITAYKFSHKMKSIRWQDVRKIQKIRLWNIGANVYQNRYYIYNGKFGPLRKLIVNLRGPIVFTDEIRGLRDLIDKINRYAQQYEIRLVILDQEAARKLASQKGAGSWARTAPKADEIRVTEL